MNAARCSFFHPVSGFAILGLDWLFFGLEWELGPVSMAAGCLAAAVLTFAAVSRVQQRWGGDDPRQARIKAALGALAAGVPFAIGGTAVGGLILLLSGLKRLRLPLR